MVTVPQPTTLSMEVDRTRTEMEMEKLILSATTTAIFIRPEEGATASTSSLTRIGWPRDTAVRDTPRATTTLSHNTFPLAASPSTCKASSIGTRATGNSILSSDVPITFTAIASSGTPPYTFSWNFGDGGSATGSQATHVYTTSGSFTVTLTTNDSAGQTAMTSNTINVSKRITSTTIICSPASVQIGQSSTCTASVKDTSPGTPGTPAGTVSFTTKGGRGSFSSSPCSLLAVNSTNASCNVSYTPSGTKARTDTITGTYSPAVSDTLHNGSSGTFSLVVTKGGLHPTSTTINCTPSTVVVDQSASCIATVTDTSSSSATAPTGTVAFTPGGTCILGGPSGASASCSVIVIPTSSGTLSISASYSGDSTHSASSGSSSLAVNKRATSTMIVCSPASVQIGQSSTCTASVKDTSPGTPGTPTGTVSFTTKGGRGSFNSSPCSLLAVNSTNASCNVSYTPSGTKARTDTITGTYSPAVSDTLHNGSSGTFSLVVTKGGLHPTSTTINCTPSTVVVDQSASCIATVTDTSSSSATAPTGTVAFTPGGTCILGSPSGASASCSVTVIPTSAGTLSISASYSGDSTHSASSGSSSLAVNKRATSTMIVCSPASVQIGQSSTCTASVKDTSPGTPSTPAGTVNFTNSGGSFTGTPCSLSAVNSTTASCSVSFAPSGTSARTETITGTYTPAQSDTFHDGSLGTFPLSVIVAGLHSTSTSVTCTPSNVVVNQAT